MSGLTPLLHPSPNFGPRRGGQKPDLIVIHYTAMDSAEAALKRLCDPQYEVSAHYLIASDGEVYQLVDETMRAWHAGAGEWCGQGDVNSRSIGIELDNAGDHPFAEPQMRALEHLVKGIMQRWQIPAHGVIGHSDMAPGRKIDPGPRFDWLRLVHQNLAAASGDSAAPQDVSWTRFRKLAQDAGYTCDCSDQDLLAAIRLRHRPYGIGRLVAADLAALPKGHSPF